jgi:hypothetical protein
MRRAIINITALLWKKMDNIYTIEKSFFSTGHLYLITIFFCLIVLLTIDDLLEYHIWSKWLKPITNMIHTTSIIRFLVLYEFVIHLIIKWKSIYQSPINVFKGDIHFFHLKLNF